MFNYACWNIHGFSQEKLANEKFYEKYDIFGLTETWTNKDTNIILPGYRSFTSYATKGKRRKGRHSGGLILYIREDLFNKGFIQKIKTTKNFIWLKLSKHAFNFSFDIYLCLLYIPPRIKSVCPENDETFDKLKQCIQEYSTKGKLVLMGDFNARTGSLNDFVELDQLSRVDNDLLPSNYTEDIDLPFRENVDQIVNDQGKQLLHMCIESKLRILNGRILGDSLGYNTYFGPRGSSTIDYFIVSEDLFSDFDFINVCPPNELSDHSVIWCGMKMDATYEINDESGTVHDTLPGKFIVDEHTKQKYIESLIQDESVHLLQEFLNDVDDNDIGIDTLTVQFTNIIHLSALKCAKFRTYRRYKNKKSFKKKWFNNNCYIMKRELRKLGRRLQIDSNNYNLKFAFHKLKKEYNKTLKWTQHKFFKSIIEQLDTLHENEPKTFWKTLDHLSNKKSNNTNPITLSSWYNYLSELYSEKNSDLDLSKLDVNTMCPLDYPFNCKEIRTGIVKMKNNKQPGLDLILNEFIKYGKDILLLPIVKLFNRILRSGTFPDSWNVSLVSFLPKNNELYECDNYRCLSLTSCLGKLFTSLLHTRLHNHMETNNLYNKFQAGFRPGYRTTDHIFTIKTIINKYLLKCKRKIYACFVDFSKAFDTVWRSGLFQKLITLGIGGNFYQVVKYMYSNSKFVVKKDNILSQSGKSERGVRQGDSLSPLLFNIFINDIDKIFDQSVSDPVVLNSTKLNCLIYADDVLLLSESKEGLQSCLNSLQTYCDFWKLKINTDKTKVIIFSVGKTKKENIQFKLNDSVIEIVEKYKYLGILLSYNGNLKHAADHMYQKSLKAIFSLKSKILDYDSMSNTLKFKLFDTLIRPILTYGAEIWVCDYNIKEKTLDTLPFEKIHNRFCKYLLGVHKKASNLASRLEFGREPILNYISSQTFKYYSRLCQLPEGRLLKEVFQLDKNLFHDGYKSWYSFIHNSIHRLPVTESEAQSCDMSEIISNQYLSNLNKELSLLNNQVQDNKLNTFSKIYTQFSLQNYLSFGLPKTTTKELSKLRISAHDLLIERGRYFRPQIPRNKRLCVTCNQIENEEHFMLYCSKFSLNRTNLFKKLNLDYHDLAPNTDTAFNIFHHLLNPRNAEETKLICGFISSSLSIR